MPDHKQILLKLDPGLYRRLAVHAAATDTNKTALVRRYVAEGLAREAQGSGLYGALAGED